ncbi:MAG: SHOCT domain-containing protein [Dehalococcoidia bacterium]
MVAPGGVPAVCPACGAANYRTLLRCNTCGAHLPTTFEEDEQDDTLIGQLERLASLHRSGALSDEEFQAAKAAILGYSA